MAELIDSSLWVDYTRLKSPPKLKAFIAEFILDTDAHLAEPVVFEMFRCASISERNVLRENFELLPILATRTNLWTQAAELGQRCCANGFTAGAIDLLIAAVALEHDACVVTFDGDFEKIAEVSDLRVRLLERPK